MWKNRVVKGRARKSLRANYLIIVGLCFIMTFFGIFSGLGSTFQQLDDTEDAVETWASGEAETETFKPGMIRYLDAYFTGDGNREKIAEKAMKGFKNTGGIIYNIMYRVDQLVFSHNGLAKLIIGMGIFAYLIYYLIIRNLLILGASRFLLETRVYAKTPFRRLFFLVRRGHMKNPVKTMLIRMALLAGIGLLMVAPIGGLTVAVANQNLIMLIVSTVVLAGLGLWYLFWSYSLMLVPYIQAENPTMPWMEVISLSRDMMKGNRLHAFGLEASFIPWGVLSFATLGILSVFFLTPYRYLSQAEIYITLREHALEKGLKYSEGLNDVYLTQPPEEVINKDRIWSGALKERERGGDLLIIIDTYPVHMLHEDSWLAARLKTLDPNRHYALLTLVLLFFIFSCIGWCWEVFFHLVRHGNFVNRGSMAGPWLPIYGVGGVMILFLLRRFAQRPVVMFLSTIILCCAIEYFGSWLLETTRHLRYWDYSDYFMNLNGRICLEGALTFALGGCLIVYFVAPRLDNVLRRVDRRYKMVAACILIILFCVDSVYSYYNPRAGKGITYHSVNSELHLGGEDDQGRSLSSLQDTQNTFIIHM